MILSDQPAHLSGHTRDALYEGRRTIARHSGVLATPDGPLPITRDVYEVGQAAAVIPYDPDRDRLVLLRQFRMTAFVSGWDADMVEIPAGMIEDGEDAAFAARREMAEELGIAATALEPAFQFMPSAGWMAQKGHVFLGRVDSSLLPERAGIAEDAELTRPFAVPVETALAALDAGHIRNGYTVIALHWFARHRSAIRERWRLEG